MALSPHAHAVVETYHRRLRYVRGLQAIEGSNWTAEAVNRWMVPHVAAAAQALYRLGLDRDYVAELLADPSPHPIPASTLGEHMNRLIREGRI